MTIYPIAFKIGQSKLKTLANTIWTLSNRPEIFKCDGKVAKIRQIWSRNVYALSLINALHYL